MRIAVCEDTAADAQAISLLLAEYPAKTACSTHVFSSAAELLAAQSPFDCYLLDILMQGQNGIELARELRRRGDRGQIVFLTSSPDYALPAFGVQAADYLLKPVAARELFRALDAAAEELALRRLRARSRFSFRTPGGLRTVTMQDILYVEIMGHTPFFYLPGEVVRGSELRVSFEESVAALIESGGFLRPHRSYLVNAAHVVALNSQVVKLDSGVSIPIARMRASAVKAAYLDHLMEARHDG